jgi:hypothetical protein
MKYVMVIIAALVIAGVVAWQLLQMEVSHERRVATEVIASLAGTLNNEANIKSFLEAFKLRKGEVFKLITNGISVSLQCLSEEPPNVTVFVITSLPDAIVVTYDTREPEKGIQSYKF